MKKYENNVPVNIRLGVVHFVYTNNPEDLQVRLILSLIGVSNPVVLRLKVI